MKVLLLSALVAAAAASSVSHVVVQRREGNQGPYAPQAGYNNIEYGIHHGGGYGGYSGGYGSYGGYSGGYGGYGGYGGGYGSYGGYGGRYGAYGRGYGGYGYGPVASGNLVILNKGYTGSPYSRQLLGVDIRDSSGRGASIRQEGNLSGGLH